MKTSDFHENWQFSYENHNEHQNKNQTENQNENHKKHRGYHSQQVVFHYDFYLKSGNFHIWKLKSTEIFFSVLHLALLEEEFVHIGDQTWHCLVIISRPLW